MRQAEKVRKKFLSRIPFILNPGKKIPKKNSKKIQKILKPLSGNIYKNSEKNSNKIQKIKIHLSGISFCKNWMRQAKKEKKKFQSRILFILDPGKKIPKKIVRKFKKL